MNQTEQSPLAIVATGISKGFQRKSKQTLPGIIREGFGFQHNKPPQSDEGTIWALKDISFSIPLGQILGIIGNNGAGKSTLLRLMAGLSRPSQGEIRANGRVSAMLSLVTALNPDLSGRKNIVASGVYNGYSWSEIKKNTESIIEFADLGEFIDHPFRTYSSGMQARLSFSIVTGFDFTDTLLIDEALGAGDARFAGKAWARMRDLILQGRTVVVVSHSMDTIRSLCQRVIWLEHGSIHMDGDPDAVIDAYRQTTSQKNEQKELMRFKKRIKSSPFDILKVELRDKEGQLRSLYEPGELLCVNIHYVSPEKTSNVRFRIDLRRADGSLISSTSCPPDQDLGWFDGAGLVTVVFDHILFAQGAYYLIVLAETASGEVLVDTQTSLLIEDPHFSQRGGIPVLLPTVTWQWDRETHS